MQLKNIFHMRSIQNEPNLGLKSMQSPCLAPINALIKDITNIYFLHLAPIKQFSNFIDFLHFSTFSFFFFFI